MHAVTVWVLVNLLAHQPMPQYNPYAFVTLPDCQHAIQVMEYPLSEYSCRQLTFATYGDYGAKDLAVAMAPNLRGERNAAYDLAKLRAIIGTAPARRKNP